jgi:hypothetical protein
VLALGIGGFLAWAGYQGSQGRAHGSHHGKCEDRWARLNRAP